MTTDSLNPLAKERTLRRKEWIFQGLTVLIAILYSYQFLRVVIVLVEDIIYWFQFTRVFEGIHGIGAIAPAVLRIIARDLTLATILDLFLAVFFFRVAFYTPWLSAEEPQPDGATTNRLSVSREMDTMRKNEICGNCRHFLHKGEEEICGIRDVATKSSRSCFSFNDGIYRFTMKK